MEAVILEALALQTFFRQLPEAERKKLAQEVSEEHVSIQLAQWQSALTYAERAAAEADRDLQQARKILATKEGQICSMSMKSVQCRLSCLTLLYEARLRAVSKRWDVILQGRDELVKTAREMGFCEGKNNAPTTTATRWLKTIGYVYTCGDDGKLLLSFLLREGSLVPEGGLRTALESVCGSSKRPRGAVDLLQKLLHELNRGEKAVVSRTFSSLWRPLLTPMDARDSTTVVSVAAADDTLNEGASAPALEASETVGEIVNEETVAETVGEETVAEPVADVVDEETVDETVVDEEAVDKTVVDEETVDETVDDEETADETVDDEETAVDKTVDEGVAPMEVCDPALEGRPTAAAVATEMEEAAGAEAEGAIVGSQQAGAGETTPFAAADASMTVTAMEPQPEPPEVLPQEAVQASEPAIESGGIIESLSPATALKVARRVIKDLFRRYPGDACLLEALRSELSTDNHPAPNRRRRRLA